MPLYEIKKGYENRVFSEEGIERISDTQIRSDHELTSPYLTLIREDDQQQMTAERPVESATTAAPAQPIINQTPAAPAPDTGVSTAPANVSAETPAAPNIESRI